MRRVVVTGMGVVAPNGNGIEDFDKALSEGKSGITHIKAFEELGFSCQVGGIPHIDSLLEEYFTSLELRMIESSGIRYGVIAGMEAWNDAGLEIDENEANYDHGVIFGAGISGVDKFREAIYKVDAKKVRRLGSNAVINTMTSGVSAFLSGKIGAGNQVTTNSSACVTGTESILMAYDRIRYGNAERILAGSCSENGPYIWGGFDAMRVMNSRENERPEKASRPLSATAKGFVPGSGAAALVLESLESARNRNAKIYAEIIGGNINSGGHRQGGSMTAPNGHAVQRCIKDALKSSNIEAGQVDYINGHLTATTKDAFEIANWKAALELDSKSFPYINSTKSMIGHCLAASGSLESVASILQLVNNKIYPSINCEDLNEEVASLIDPEKVPQTLIQKDLQIIANASFGFGDVNACIIFKKIS